MADVIDPNLSWSNLKASFEAVDPEVYKQVQNPAETFKSLRDIDDWASHAKQSFTDEIKTNRPEWVAREVDKVWLERENMAPELKPPLPDKSLSQEARERVDRRIEGVFQGIDQHRQTERQRVLSDPEYKPSQSQEQTRAHPLSKDTHKAMDKSWHKLDEDFDRFLQDAGIDRKAPEAQAFKDKMEYQRKAQHRDVGRAFNTHGLTRQPAQTQSQSGPSSS